ncbi:hypothetical protein SAM23877_5130 [Streptomyces ambofaciens ATCC 23877]|uniref:Uncharacterized protein n=1 Tax=Streptomyces ambofaciens (strain ATCC 23877 / 3486 / DSM 40053 / JCM 4204 / NBRC 12836 / NRRL B-2516) TaxID=278992 RepID=A0A0K2AYH0_STRA7|nr:hypothetical protein SAM23877_5130 [Streptomyces ambofaciens ATCC 23877]
MAAPPVGASSVVSIRRVVVLPAPLGPRKPRISPARTVRSMPRTASTGPCFVSKVRARPAVLMIAMAPEKQSHSIFATTPSFQWAQRS